MRVRGSESARVLESERDEDPGVPHPAAHESRGLPRGAAVGRQRAEQASPVLSGAQLCSEIHFI